MQYNTSQQLWKLQFQYIIMITIIRRVFNIVSFTVYHLYMYIKVDCSAWGTQRGQGHWRRQHFYSQQHGELCMSKKCNRIMIIAPTIMIEFTSQNVVTVLCPLVHRFTTVKGLQYTNQLRFCWDVNCASLSEITEWVNLLMFHESTGQRLSLGITDFNL